MKKLELIWSGSVDQLRLALHAPAMLYNANSSVIVNETFDEGDV
jgi:hypothetical protein